MSHKTILFWLTLAVCTFGCGLLLSSCRTTHYIPLPSSHHRDSLVTRVNTRVDSIRVIAMRLYLRR